VLPRDKSRFIATTTRRDLVPLNGAVLVRMESLRERPKFVIALAQRYVEAACARTGMAVPPISNDALSAIRAHSWPGNVLELKATMERALKRAGGGEQIEPRHLAFGDDAG
jgi:DNA-binding NtrC family response regulator